MAQNDQLLGRDRPTLARGGGRPWMLLGAGLVLGVVLTLTLVWWLGRKKDVQTIVRDIRERVLLLETFDEKGERIGYGTGFLVEPGLVATNWHVIARGDRLTATDSRGETYQATALKGADIEADAAVVRLEDCYLKPLSLAANLDEALPGTPILVVGNPEGFEGTVTEGVISSIRPKSIGLREVDEVQISAAISPGSSGSPVVEAESGEVIGIATRVSEGNLVNFAVGIESLRGPLGGMRPLDLPGWADHYYLELKADRKLSGVLHDYDRATEKRNWKSAEEDSKTILERFPENAIALRARGAVLGKMRRHEEALPYLQAAVDREPESGVHRNLLALNLHAAKKLPEAAAEFDELVTRFPDYVNYRYCQIFVRDQIGWKTKCHEALQELRRFPQVIDDLSLEKAREVGGILFFSDKKR